MSLGIKSAILEKIQAHNFRWTGPEPVGASEDMGRDILIKAIEDWLEETKIEFVPQQSVRVRPYWYSLWP